MFGKIIIAASLVVAAFAGTAQITWYESYPRCCYDKTAPNQDECTKYNGCKWAGKFANGQSLTLEQVKNTPIVSFFDSKYPTQAQWEKHYQNTKVRITKNGVTFDAFIKDTCSDSDVSGGANTCTHNAKGGVLIDVEYFTAKNYLGGTGKATGTATFEILN